MTTKLIILLSFGTLVLGVLIRQIVRAWRYRRDHPDEVYWPYNRPNEKPENVKQEKEHSIDEK